MEVSHSGMNAGAGLEALASADHEVHLKHIWHVECLDRDGKLKWVEDFENLVTTVGKNKYLDATIKTGLTTPAWYVGLKDTGTAVVGDTMSSHGSWVEIHTIYSQGTRPAYTPGTISGGSVDNSASKAVFSITSSDDVYGAFLVDENTKNGTSGTLLAVGDFAAQRSVANGDTLNVQITLTIT